MILPKKRGSEQDCRMPRRWSNWRLLGAWVVALTVAAIILIIFRPSMARADEGTSGEPGAHAVHYVAGTTEQAACSPSGSDLYDGLELTAISPLDYNRTREGESTTPRGCDMTSVWSTTLAVGQLDGDTDTYLGYSATGNTAFGKLGDTDFHYNLQDYTVAALYYQYQENISTYKQLVISANTRLPSRLSLLIDGERFRVSESKVLGSNQNIHAWPLDEDPGWVEGLKLRVKMTSH